MLTNSFEFYYHILLNFFIATFTNLDYGCDQFPAGIYHQRSDFDNETIWNSIPDIYKCENPNKQATISGFYWVSYTAIASLIVLSLFVGIISINMQESMNEMKKEIEETNRKAKIIQNVSSLYDVTTKANAMTMAQALIENSGVNRNTVIYRGRTNEAALAIHSKTAVRSKSFFSSLYTKIKSLSTDK